ncbi:protocadherin Fat 2-like [Pollicipes pollicipes]|uniref:protocadherin Fat 2-like n=1 Tax=Pollicipes pollicipes TaxID=41117 RepID=UPI0018849CF8|nr:protocadherin Fat 2-like [Pollicipes pollicipes]
MDDNDNRPVFVNQPYHAVVPVEATVGAPVTKVTAIDADLGDNGRVHYDLLRGNGDLFAVDLLSGAVTLRRSPRGLDTAFRLVVTAYDGGSPPLSSEAEVLVTTVDGSQPRFSQPHYWARVAESAERRTPVLTLEADAPSASSLVFQLTEPAVDSMFAVDFTTGVLYVAGELDYETRPRYELMVSATDRVTGSMTSVPVTVNVTDVNDNAPQFERSVYNVTASEAAHPGLKLLHVKVTDRDQEDDQPLSFRVQEADGSESFLFHMTSDGSLAVTSYLDFEQRAAAPAVEDVNDNVPVFDRASYACELTELPSRGQFVTMVKAHDPDPTDQLVYRIADGNDRQLFYINRRTGVITVANIRAFDESPQYQLNITAADGIHHTYVPLTVRLMPANKHAPAFEKVAYEVDLSEDVASGTPVTQVKAYDPDRGPLGVISTRQRLDRETEPVLKLPVGTYAVLCTGVISTVKVRLSDVNDNAPRFQLAQYRAVVAANLTAGDVVCKVTAYDSDEGDNARIAYSIFETEVSDIRKALDIDSETGEIILMQQPNQLGEQFHPPAVAVTRARLGT